MTEVKQFVSYSIFLKKKIIILDKLFYGGKLVAIFGAIKLDLKNTVFRLDKGKIEATAIFGSIEIITAQ